VGNLLIGYRKDVFEKNNIPAPKDWNDVVSAAKTLNGKDGMAGIAIPAKRTDAPEVLMAGLISMQGTWWIDDQGRPAVDKAKLSNAFKQYAEAAKYAPSGVLNAHFDEAATAAAQGKAAQLLSITPVLAWLEDPSRSQTVGKWGYIPLKNQNQIGGEFFYWLW